MWYKSFKSLLIALASHRDLAVQKTELYIQQASFLNHHCGSLDMLLLRQSRQHQPQPRDTREDSKNDRL